jgi:hypothetical protein
MKNEKAITNKYIIIVTYVFFLIPFVTEFIIPYILNGSQLLIRYEFPGQNQIYFKTFEDDMSYYLKLAFFYSVVFVIILTFFFYLIIRKKKINYNIQNYKSQKNIYPYLIIFLILEALYVQTYIFNQNIFFQIFEAIKYVLTFYFILLTVKEIQNKNFIIIAYVLLFIFFFSLFLLIFIHSKSSIFEYIICNYLLIFYLIALKVDRNKIIVLIMITIISIILTSLIKENIRSKHFSNYSIQSDNTIFKNLSAMENYYNNKPILKNFNTSEIRNEKIKNNIQEGYLNKIPFLEHKKFRSLHNIYQRLNKLSELAWIIGIHLDNELINRISNGRFSKKNLLLGETYRPLISKIIPRFLYQNKPKENYGNIYGHDYYLMTEFDKTTSQNLHVLIESYMNFSFYGILLLSIFIGFLFFIIMNIVLKTKSELNKFLFISPIILFGFSMESNFSLSFSGIIFIYLIMFIFMNDSFKKKIKSIFIMPLRKIVFPS